MKIYSRILPDMSIFFISHTLNKNLLSHSIKCIHLHHHPFCVSIMFVWQTNLQGEIRQIEFLLFQHEFVRLFFFIISLKILRLSLIKIAYPPFGNQMQTIQFYLYYKYKHKLWWSEPILLTSTCFDSKVVNRGGL